MATEEIDVVVIGAGQAGLAASHELTARGVPHVVLERSGAVGGAWAGRWDSFCLVTPNHTIRLPGGEYRGEDPDGYLPRDEIVGHLQRYAASFAAPVRTGVAVTSLRGSAGPGGGLTLRTADDGVIQAREVVVATGAFQEAHHPAWVADLPSWLPVIDSREYRNPDALPPGAVVVVGSGQTGCQLAEELVLAGRRVVLACGRAPWVPRRLEGRDIVDWLLEVGFFDQTTTDIPEPAARVAASVQATGARGGHDLHSRTLQALGVELAGHLSGVADDGATAVFADDLAESVAFGDARYADLRAALQGGRRSHRLSVPAMPDPPPFDAGRALERLDLRGVGAVIVTAGYRPRYRSWIAQPAAFDPVGFPLQVDGASTVVPGLRFVGMHLMRKVKSALLLGVGEDAAQVADQVAASTASA